MKGRADLMRDDSTEAWARRLRGIRNPDLATKPETYVLLEAGARLLEAQLRRGLAPVKGLSEITRKDVVRLAQELIDELAVSVDPRTRTLTGAFNNRWNRDQFREDVIVYELFARRWPEAHELSRQRIQRLAEDVICHRLSGSDYIRAIVKLELRLHARFMCAYAFRASVAADPVLGELATAAHEEFIGNRRADWISTLEGTQTVFGTVLRPGISLDDALMALVAIVRQDTTRTNADDTEDVERVAVQVMTHILGMAEHCPGGPPQEAIDHLFGNTSRD